MGFLSWLVAAAILDEYFPIIVGLIIGIPLTFVHPILGVIVGVLIALSLKYIRKDKQE